MSGFLGLGVERALGLSSSPYRAASFRGAPFFVVEESGEDGRSLGIHVMPLRETHEVEDLGRALSRLQVNGYVIGEGYLAARDALIKACAASDEPGTLILPTIGERTVRCESVRYAHNMKEGGFVAFEFTFVEAAAAQPATGKVSSLREALRAAGQVLATARRTYALYRAANGNLGAFLSRAAGAFANDLAGDLANEWLGLPGLDLTRLRASLDTLGDSDGEDATATATATTAPFQALAEAATTTADTTIATGGGAAQAAGASRPEPQLPGLRATLLVARAAPPAVPEDADTQAIADLARDAAAAAAAIATINAPWSTAQQALAARDALITVLDGREVSAADREEADLAADFRALAAEAQRYLTETAAALPVRASYTTPAPAPALALAQLLHGDAGREGELVSLNAPRHPAFMPIAGDWLRA